MIQQERTEILNRKSIRNRKYVLYWMQGAQRAEYNHALEYAIEWANEQRRPLVACLGITDDYPEANLRHYAFMLEGLVKTQKALEAKGIQLIIRHQQPDLTAIELSRQASVVVVDAGQLRIQRKWRKNVADKIDCALHEVETNLIVPVETASVKEEFSAGTFRPRITKKLNSFLIPLKHKKPKVDSLRLSLGGFDISNIDKALASLRIDRSVGPITTFHGGTDEAKRRLKNFINNKLDGYAHLRNNPGLDYLSNMSPYLHFGQISPLYIALQIMKTKSPGKDAYLEELIVRRELSHNYVFYNSKYDTFAGLPPWAKTTLNFHRRDKRKYIFSLKEFEEAATHDPYWNTAQKEMVLTGKMHGYMRMYWGKKILEWSRTPKTAFKTALYLNNKYELDGRDPNGFTGVAWCFGKHDRAWGRRPIFGKIRYMNAAGLKRKFDVDKYLNKIKAIETSK